MDKKLYKLGNSVLDHIQISQPTKIKKDSGQQYTKCSREGKRMHNSCQQSLVFLTVMETGHKCKKQT